MNYSEKATHGATRRMSHSNRIMISLALSFALGLVIGSLIFMGQPPLERETAFAMEDVQRYGTIDGKSYATEPSIDWMGAAELGFTPLEIDMDVGLQEFTYCLAYEYNVDFPFIMGLIQHESTFRTNVVSKTNDYGLMQINKVNHEWLTERFGFDDYLDPYQNIRAGTYILRTLFEKYEDPAHVLMAYNLGEAGAKRLWEKGIYDTPYSNSVLNKVSALSAELKEKDGK